VGGEEGFSASASNFSFFPVSEKVLFLDCKLAIANLSHVDSRPESAS
jgi:hypothetical protein